MNTVKKGCLAEYKVKKRLEKEGYSYFIRSHGSRTPIDLLASDGNAIIAVQVKSGYISSEEKTNLIEWATKFNAIPHVARKERGRWVVSRI